MKYLILVFSLMLFFTACKKDGGPLGTASGTDSTEEANKARFRAAYDIFSNGNLDALDTLVDANFTEHTPWPGQEPGLAGLKKGFTEFRAAFPDMKMTLNHVWADGDVVIGHFTQTGTMTGTLGGMPASNKAMNISGVDIVRIKDGKAVEHWGYSEENKMAQQMGWMPSMEGGAPSEKPGTGGTGGTPKSDAPKGTPKSKAPEPKPKY